MPPLRHLCPQQPERVVQPIPDKENEILSIREAGITITKAAMLNNLGTIGKSGTKVPGFCLAGLYGGPQLHSVDFYSAYLVSDRVQAISKHDDDEQYIRESAAGDTLTITPDAVNPSLGRCTEVRLFFKEDQLDSYPTRRDQGGREDKEFENETEEEEEEGEGEKPKIEEEKKAMEKNKEKAVNLTKDWEDHLAVNHFSVEGPLEFKAILCILKRSPFDLFKFKKKRHNVKLYAPRVFIVDDCEDFIRDLRETPQQNKICKVICKNLAKKTLDLITEIAEDKNSFNMFYEAFSKNINLGVHDDAQKRSKLAEVLRVYSIKSAEELISLKGKSEFVLSWHFRMTNIHILDYIIRTPERASTISLVNPVLKKKGSEVLLVDPFGGKKLICVSKGSLELRGIEEKKGCEALVAEFSELCSTVKDALGERVEKVDISNRITDSPCVFVTVWPVVDTEPIMKAQGLRDSSLSSHMASKKTPELYHNYLFFKELDRKVKEDKADKSDKSVRDFTFLLYETALLTSGFCLDDPTTFSKLINRLITLDLDVDKEGAAPSPAAEDPAPVDGAPTSAIEEID
ncbi:LOW QUALITY PROTEIN: hypothetical protein CVT26_012827 [Gymnopilus dilepis]|uniref:Uncharacterized protein n=1 Tax=Gymnopilus dilepis TaxID=231916 RepID=A0A409Y482_9AGAR|nr:LOW QUALITY PROTEIN: hypothetical protein CVT26_012827 [Gymnopilus dilepis]